MATAPIANKMHVRKVTPCNRSSVFGYYYLEVPFYRVEEMRKCLEYSTHAFDVW